MMNSQTMKWSFKPSLENFQGRVVRISIYLQSKVLEIKDTNDSVFYLVYFKNTLLGGGKLEQLNKESFIYEAFEQGMTIEPSHPLYPLLIPKNRKATIPQANTLFTELQNKLSLQEIALSASYMDSFIDKQQLTRIIREIFNHYRRNGQFLKAYQILKVLLQFSPHSKATKELIRSAEFDKYRMNKEEEYDVFWMERFYYQHCQEREFEIKLHKLLKEQSRNLERLVLFIHLHQMNHDFYDEEQFMQLLQQELKPEDQYATLKFLWKCSPNHPLISKQLLQLQLSLKLYSEAIDLIANQTEQPAPSYDQMIEQIIERVEPSSLSQIQNINQLISRLYSTNPEKKETQVRRMVIALLHDHNPDQVKDWLKPIREKGPALRVIEDIDQLESLSQDSDQLTKLGKLYYDFELLDQSIECFTWEMELKPTSVDPVRWLSKLYLEKGMKEESDDYKKLSVLLAKKE
jgi:hypothetical protein